MVEDDPTTRKALGTILGRRGFDVVAVANLADARPALDSIPDILVMDLMLPDGDGASLLRAVRRADWPTRVVVTTGVTDPHRLVEVQALDPHCILFKPIELARLLEAIGPGP